ncbi:DDE_3 domain-containing protein [Trichonephila clavipes]|nr:DDE_3 domain-containing protein [Trichonephila clavipes]
MERTRDPLSAIQCLRNRPLWQWRLDGPGRHHAGGSMSLKEALLLLAHLVDEFLESKDIRRMNWPVRSPDLMPKEHARETLGRPNPLLEPSKN